MKTKEELKNLSQDIQNMRAKLAELNEEELEQVVGGNTTMPWLILRSMEDENMGVPFVRPDDEPVIAHLVVEEIRPNGFIG